MKRERPGRARMLRAIAAGVGMALLLFGAPQLAFAVLLPPLMATAFSPDHALAGLALVMLAAPFLIYALIEKSREKHDRRTLFRNPASARTGASPPTNGQPYPRSPVPVGQPHMVGRSRRIIGVLGAPSPKGAGRDTGQDAGGPEAARGERDGRRDTGDTGPMQHGHSPGAGAALTDNGER